MSKENQSKENKPFYKKWWVWVLAVVALLFFAALVADPEPELVENGEDVEAEEEEVEVERFGVGDSVRIGDTVLSVESVDADWQSSDQFDTPSEGYVYVVLNVTVRNEGSERLELSGFWDFQLEDANGVLRNEALAGFELNSLSEASSLSAGGETSGHLIFEVPEDATSDMTLHYEPLFDTRTHVEIDLQ